MNIKWNATEPGKKFIQTIEYLETRHVRQLDIAQYKVWKSLRMAMKPS